MKSPFNFTNVAACLLAATAFALPAVSQAGSVVVNGTQVCTDTPQLSMDPSGNLQVTCTASGGGGTTFGCTLSPLTQTITLGSTTTATIAATCTNAAQGSTVSYTWTSTGANAANNPPFTAGTDTTATLSIPGPFATAGSYQYKLTATDGTSTVTPIGTLNVQTVSSCATSSVTGAFTAAGQSFTGMMPPGGYIAYSMPIFTAANLAKLNRLSMVDASGSSTHIAVQIAISKCPGDFNVDTACQAQTNTSTGSLSSYVGATETPGTGKCTLATGAAYYVNVRPVLADHVTASCTVQSKCGVVLTYR